MGFWHIYMGLYGGGEAIEVIAGVQAANLQAYIPGLQSGQAYIPGAAKLDIYIPGSVSAQ